MTVKLPETRVLLYLAQTFGFNEVQAKFAWPAECGVSSTTVEKKVVEDDDDFDLFGEETAAEKQAKEALAQKTKEASTTKKPKKVVINKSTLVIEVKPNSAETDLQMIEKGVREIAMDGLEWSKVSKQVPIAFGLFKLQIGCVIEDDKVETTNLLEAIEMLGMDELEKAAFQKRVDGEEAEEDEDDEAPGWVQSAEIVSFQKL